MVRTAEGLPAHLKAMERAGLVRIGTGVLPAGFWDLPLPSDPDGAAVRALLSERDEGR